MKKVLILTDWKWVPGSTKEMMYKDDKGNWFVGKASNATIGKTYIVELSEGQSADGYYHIIKFC